MYIYGIFDKKTESFTNYFLIDDVRILKISLLQTLKSEKINVYNSYPEDFALKKIGSIDNASGTLFQDIQKECDFTDLLTDEEIAQLKENLLNSMKLKGEDNGKKST